MLILSGSGREPEAKKEFHEELAALDKHVRSCQSDEIHEE